MLRLVRRLAEARGRAVTREALLFSMQGDRLEPPDSDVLTTMLWRLRRQIPGAIQNVYGQGYRMRADFCEAFLDATDDAHVVLARSDRDEAAFRAMRARR